MTDSELRSEDNSNWICVIRLFWVELSLWKEVRLFVLMRRQPMQESDIDEHRRQGERKCKRMRDRDAIISAVSDCGSFRHHVPEQPNTLTDLISDVWQFTITHPSTHRDQS